MIGNLKDINPEEKHKVLCEVLETLIDEGLRFNDAVCAFAKRRSPEELALRDLAGENYESEGEIEIDENAYVSWEPSDPDTKGAYVMAWVWVDKDA